MADEIRPQGQRTRSRATIGVKRVDADSPSAPDGAAIADQGAGNNPGESTNPDEMQFPRAPAAGPEPNASTLRPNSRPQ